MQGFVLDGFPKTIDQVAQLGNRQMKLTPSFVVVLECSDKECMERLKTRKIDPVTGNVYEKDG